MATRKINFTPTRLKELPTPEKRTIWYDETVTGLRLLVTPTGNKSFQVQVWSKKLQKPMTKSLGKLNAVDLSEVRVAATDFINEVNKGVDVEEMLRNERKGILNDPTVNDLAEKFLKEHVNKKTDEVKKSHKADVSMMQNKILPYIGKIKVNAVTIDDVEQVVEEAQKKKKIKYKVQSGKTASRVVGGKVTANRVVSLLKVMFNFAVKKRMVQFSVCTSLEKVHEEPRSRVLKDVEIVALYGVLDGSVSHKMIKFLFCTGQRSGEVRLAKWREIEGTTWTIPAERTKTITEHVVPLSKTALLILESIEREGEYVFTESDDLPRTRHYLPQYFCRVSKKLDFEQEIQAHDLRRTCKTRMAKMGIKPHISERVLNHSQKGISSVYDKHDYYPEKARALQKWSDLLERILGVKKKDNLIQMVG